MKVGDKVEWESQSSGFKTKKVGTIRVVVPPYDVADRYIPKGNTSWRMGLSRDHESYLVKVEGKGNRLYWPLVKYLKKVPVPVKKVQDITVPAGRVLWFSNEKANQEIHFLNQEIASLQKKIDALEIGIGENSRRHGIFMRKIKKMLGYKNWPDIQGDFLDGVAALIENKIKKDKQRLIRSFVIWDW